MALSDSLISYWKLDEASGTRADEVGGNTLTDNNTVTSAAGKIGNAAQFAVANTEFLSHADNAALSTGDIDFTIQAWVKFATKVSYMIVVAKGDNFTRLEFLLQWDAVGDRLRFIVTSNGSAFTIVSANNLGIPAVDTWYHVVAWHDSVNNLIGIAVNAGTADTTSTSAGVFDSTSAFTIGALDDAGARLPMDGLIDEVGFWKRVLTSLERTALYNGGAGLPYSSIAPAAASGGNKSGLLLMGVG